MKDYAALALTGCLSLSKACLGFETKKVEIMLCMAGAGMWAGGRGGDNVCCRGTEGTFPHGFVSLVDISLGDAFLCLILCSIADDSRNAQILELIWGLNFYKGVFSGILLQNHRITEWPRLQ